MARVTLCLLFLLLVLTLQQSDADSEECNNLEEENNRLEKDLARVTAHKHQYEQFYGQCKKYVTLQNHTLETNSRKVKETEEVNSYLKTTIDCLTNTVQSFNRTEHGLREKEEKLQETIDGLTKTEKQLQANFDDLTKTEKANNRTVHELLEKQKQMQATIDDLTRTVNFLTCGEPKSACRYMIQAVKSGDVNAVRILAGCTDDNCTEGEGRQETPIRLAAIYGNLAVARLLLEGGASLETTDIYQSTALHAAAAYGKLNMSRLLLDGGAKMDPLNSSKRTPLHYAAQHGHFPVVQLLVLRGANIRLKDGNGKIASELARSEGESGVADWLDSVERV